MKSIIQKVLVTLIVVFGINFGVGVVRADEVSTASASDLAQAEKRESTKVKPADYTKVKKNLKINRNLPIYAEHNDVATSSDLKGYVNREQLYELGWQKDAVEDLITSDVEDVNVITKYLEKNFNMRVNYGESATNKALLSGSMYKDWDFVEVEENADFIYDTLYGVYSVTEYLPEWIFKTYSKRFGALAINVFKHDLSAESSATVGAFTARYRYSASGRLHHTEVYTKVGDTDGTPMLHEFMHIAEYILEEVDNSKYQKFKKEYQALNPNGFYYGINTSFKKNEELGNFFANEYGASSFSEDVATMAEAMYLYDTKGIEYNPALQKKIDLIRKYFRIPAKR